MAADKASKIVAEFVGTFLLVLTVGCNVITGQPVFGGISIACVLMVSIYALGGISGANFNPAVSFALALTKMLGGQGGLDMADMGIYMVVQVAAGAAAGFGYRFLLGSVVPLQVATDFTVLEAGIAEMLYTFMLCFVVLNVAVAKANKDNQYYGLAIGFVIIAGAYGAGHISGGCFNPAVALGLSLSSGFSMLSLIYVGFELVGAMLAALLFMAVRRDDFGGEVGLAQKLISEATGTFILVLTVGLNVLGDSKAGAFSIAASLLSMIYALGSVSGAHFNPAVSTAILLSGRDQIDVKNFAGYVAAQILGAMMACCVYQPIYGKGIELAPGAGYTLNQALMAEFLFTFVLAFVVLSVAVSTKTKSKDMFGLAIGCCIIVGGFAIGKISGGSLNPAVSCALGFGDDLAGIDTASINGMHVLYYSLAEVAGGAMAAAVFRLTHMVDAQADAKAEAQYGLVKP
eukprot:gb/GFBE01006243.1/.p1 GENE.gb/GFBE01006243.1/~~gb/GFBE01006243.1/.p1  ORF type:complete len:459 (+),score=145.23 gb/GFBE01006243.1/:1-1377(+)